MWAQRSRLLTHSTSFRGVLLTRWAHAFELASALSVVGLALEATGDVAAAAATAAAMATMSLHVRRPCRGLIGMLPSYGGTRRRRRRRAFRCYCRRYPANATSRADLMADSMWRSWARAPPS